MLYHIDDSQYDNRWIFYKKKVISPNIINDIDNYISNKKNLTDALISDAKYDPNIRRTKIMWLKNEDEGIPPEVLSVYDEILNGVKMVNADMWNFNIFGLDILQYGLYEAGDNGFYDWHLDCQANCTLGTFLRKLTIVIGLSDYDEYAGGELKVKIVADEKENCFKLGIGDVCVFPSFLLHKVEPVEFGSRKTLVGWVMGPSFT